MRFWNILLLLTVVLIVGSSHAQEPLSLPRNATSKATSPSIEAIQPSPVAGAQKRQWIKILGSGFTPKSQVTLRLGDQIYSIPPGRTKFVSDSELDIYANVSIGPSIWTAQVTNQGEGSSRPLSFSVKPPAMIAPENQSLKEQRRKAEIEALEKKAEETNGKIEQAEKTAEEAKLEAAQAATEKATAQQDVEEKEQGAVAAKQRLEVAKAKAQAIGTLAAQREVEALTKEAANHERAAAIEKKRLDTIEVREQAAKEKATAAETEIKKLRKEFSGLRGQRAEKLTFLEKSTTALWIIFGGLVVWFLKRLAVGKFEGATAEKKEVREGSARLETLVALLNWLGTILIVLTAGYLILDEFGISMAPILASIGIVGLALSFGGQYLIRDIINGIFILIEGQYYINDIVQIGALSGVVESVNLRHTRLRDLEGRAIYIPNGEIKTVINFTKGYGQTVLDIRVAYKENVDHVIEIMKKLVEEMRQAPQYGKLIKDFEMFGVEKLGESDVTIRCRFKTRAGKQWDVAREYRRRIKNRFDELGIEIPFPHRTMRWVFSPQGSNPMELEAAKSAASA